MSDNDAYAQPAARDENYERERSPRQDRERSRSPVRRDRSASPRREGGGGERREPDAVNPGNNLHVSGLARDVDVPMLEDLFGKAGKVQKASIMYDPHTRDSRGFGFVMMDTPEDAEAAISQCSGINLEGKTISVTHAKRARPRSPTPGRYHGVKLDAPREGGYRGGGGGGGGYDRPYQPRSYDSRYADRGPPPSRYDDRDRRYDDRPRHEERPRYSDRYERDAPPRSSGGDREYVPRGPPSGAERGYDRRDERPRYDDRRY